ncbi:calpastatin-like [Arapaima gigas]
MSQPTKTKCTSEAQASAKKPAKSETASGPPAEATPAARGGAASAVTGQASLGAAKGKQQGIKPQIKEHLQSAAASPPCTDSSKGEPAESVSAGATAAKTADSEGKTKETKSKDMSKNVPISSNKEKSAKPVVTTIAAKSPEATVTRQKSKQKSLPQAPKVSKKEESKKAAVPLAPPAEKKAKGAEGSSPQPPVEKKNKKNEDNAMSLDALSALENLLPAAEPAPEPPKVQPKDIVQPSMDSGEALDILSGDFSSSAVAPAATASAAPSKQSSPDISTDALKGDFVAPQKASSVQASIIPSCQTQQQDNSMSLDALNTLGDMLPAAEPVAKPPEIQPKDIVQGDKLKSKKAVRVGEREDTLPPDYRFKDDKQSDHPVPQKEPSMDTTEALDLLSGDFSSTAAASAPVAAPKPIQTKGQVMDALSNTLVPDAPVFKPKTATAEEAKVPSTKLKSQSEKQTEAGTSEKLTKHSGTDVASEVSSGIDVP